MQIKQMINNYRESVTKVTKSKGSYEYEMELSLFINYYFDDLDVEQLTSDRLYSFIDWMKNTRTCSNNTINKVIKYLTQVLNHYKIKLDFIEDFKSLKVKYRRFSMLTKSELYKISNYLKTMQDHGNGKQYRMMILLLFDTGVRQNELLNIEIKNINVDDRSILLTKTKNNYERVVYMSQNVTNELKEFIKTCNRKLLFYNELRKREFTRDDLRMFYRRIKTATGINKLHSHMFRHTWATEMIELDLPLSVVQKQLGHRSIKTTQIYLHMSNKYQKQMLDSVTRSIQT